MSTIIYLTLRIRPLSEQKQTQKKKDSHSEVHVLEASWDFSKELCFVKLYKEACFVKLFRAVSRMLGMLRKDWNWGVEETDLLQFLRELEEECSPYLEDDLADKKAKSFEDLIGPFKMTGEFNLNHDVSEMIVRLVLFDTMYKMGWLEGEKLLLFLFELKKASTEPTSAIKTAWTHVASSLQLLKNLENVDTQVKEIVQELGTDVVLAKPTTKKVVWETWVPQFKTSLYSVFSEDELRGLLEKLDVESTELKESLMKQFPQNPDELTLYLAEIKEKMVVKVDDQVKQFQRDSVTALSTLVSIRAKVDQAAKVNLVELLKNYLDDLVTRFPPGEGIVDQWVLPQLTRSTLTLKLKHYKAESLTEGILRLVSSTADHMISTVGAADHSLNGLRLPALQYALTFVYEKELEILSLNLHSADPANKEALLDRAYQNWINSGQPLNKEDLEQYVVIRSEDTMTSVMARLYAAKECLHSQHEDFEHLASALLLIQSIEFQSARLFDILKAESEKLPQDTAAMLVRFFTVLFREIPAAGTQANLGKVLTLIKRNIPLEDLQALLVVLFDRTLCPKTEQPPALSQLVHQLLSKTYFTASSESVVHTLNGLIQNHGQESPSVGAACLAKNKFLVARVPYQEDEGQRWKVADLANIEDASQEILPLETVLAIRGVASVIRGEASPQVCAELETQVLNGILKCGLYDQCRKIYLSLARKLLTEPSGKFYPKLQMLADIYKNRTTFTVWGLHPEFAETYLSFLDELLCSGTAKVETLDQCVELYNLLNVNHLLPAHWESVDSALLEGTYYIKYLKVLYNIRSIPACSENSIYLSLVGRAHSVSLMLPAQSIYSAENLRRCTFFPPMINWEDKRTRTCLKLLNQKNSDPGATGPIFKCKTEGCGFSVLSTASGKSIFSCHPKPEIYCQGPCGLKLGPFPGINPFPNLAQTGTALLEEHLKKLQSMVPATFKPEQPEDGRVASTFDEVWVLMKYPEIPNRESALVVHVIQNLFYQVYLHFQGANSPSAQQVPLNEFTRSQLQRDLNLLAVCLDKNLSDVINRVWSVLYDTCTYIQKQPDYGNVAVSIKQVICMHLKSTSSAADESRHSQITERLEGDFGRRAKESFFLSAAQQNEGMYSDYAGQLEQILQRDTEAQETDKPDELGEKVGQTLKQTEDSEDQAFSQDKGVKTFAREMNFYKHG